MRKTQEQGGNMLEVSKEIAPKAPVGKLSWNSSKNQCLGSTPEINPSKIKRDLTNGPLGKVLELLDTQV